ncbi:NFE2L1 family protein [Megaselia abdita]
MELPMDLLPRMESLSPLTIPLAISAEFDPEGYGRIIKEIETEDVWKQDVDLGYCLPTASDEITKETNQTENSEEDIEKLKALEELKNEKSKDVEKDAAPEDEWHGIQFTIDNETGEYIRLPSPSQFDEFLENLGDLDDIQVDDLKEEEEPVPNPITEKKEENSEEPETKEEGIETDENKEKEKACDISPLPSPLFNLDEAVNELDEIDMMIQSHHHKNNPQSYGAANSAFRQSGFHQPRGPLSRGVSMEQRLQDIANFFNPIPGMGMGVGEMPPYSHYPAHYPYQSPHQHSQFTHPAYSGLGDLNGTQPHYGHNLGSAVTSSMHLTNSSHDSADNNSTSGYKVDHDMMYYSNTSSEMNHTTEGFINSILNDEDLHLMDMNVTDNFCNLRMIDNPASNTSSLLGCATGGSTASGGASAASQHHGMMPSNLHGNGSLNITNDGSLVAGATGLATHGGGDRLDASSDSAVSSMGSERVPSLSDGEWGEGSDSAQDFHHGKYGGPYDYSYNNRMGESQNRPTAQPPVAQKKHQMYGKRFFSEQPPVQHSGGNTPIKYEYDSYNTSRLDGGAAGISATADIKYSSYADFNNRVDPPSSLINHNHTYSLPQGSGINPRPQQRDKKPKNKSNSESSSGLDMNEHLSRDEKRARSLNIPISVADIINLPMDEFNERLSKYDLTENQLSLIRDIRRRGKNKVAAQNCRKRKLDQIVNLEDEVKEVRTRKSQLYADRDSLLKEKKRVTAKFQMLHSHIFQYLRDSDGNPCSPNDYTLQQAADGSVYLLRKDSMKLDGGNMQNHHHKHKE